MTGAKDDNEADDHMQKLLRKIDDGSGTLSKSQVKKIASKLNEKLTSFLGFRHEKLDNAFDEMDPDAEGNISCESFLQWHNRWHPETPNQVEELVRHLFSELDIKKTGFLDRSGVGSLIVQLIERRNEASGMISLAGHKVFDVIEREGGDLIGVFAAIDVAHTGKVSVQDILRFFRKKGSGGTIELAESSRDILVESSSEEEHHEMGKRGTGMSHWDPMDLETNEARLKEHKRRLEIPISFDLGILFEGVNDHELPERLLATLRVERFDLGKVPKAASGLDNWRTKDGLTMIEMRKKITKQISKQLAKKTSFLTKDDRIISAMTTKANKPESPTLPSDANIQIPPKHTTKYHQIPPKESATFLPPEASFST
jgi:Ca2+-binding EF-hand superfamily protein